MWDTILSIECFGMFSLLIVKKWPSNKRYIFFFFLRYRLSGFARCGREGPAWRRLRPPSALPQLFPPRVPMATSTRALIDSCAVWCGGGAGPMGMVEWRQNAARWWRSAMAAAAGPAVRCSLLQRRPLRCGPGTGSAPLPARRSGPRAAARGRLRPLGSTGGSVHRPDGDGAAAELASALSLQQVLRPCPAEGPPSGCAARGWRRRPSTNPS